MNKEQLRFNSTILILDGKWYIEVVCNDKTEYLIFNKLMKWVHCVAGRATTCWKVYYKGNTFKIPLVIKDLWQYLQCKEEGKLLHKVMEKKVVNIARYYYHEIVYMGGKENNICNNIYKGLNIIRVINYKLEDLIITLRSAKVKISVRKGQSFSRKRSSSYINALLLPNKRICSGSPPKGIRCLITLNWVH